MFNNRMSGSSRILRQVPLDLKEAAFSTTDTWKIALWFELNPSMKKMVRQTAYFLGAPEISRWCHKLWTSGTSPTGAVLQRVDWTEIDNLWQDEAQRLVDETQKAIDHYTFKEWHDC